MSAAEQLQPLPLTAGERQRLIDQRRQHFGGWDFAPDQGRCLYCGADLINDYRDEWPTAQITGCHHCHQSYCE